VSVAPFSELARRYGDDLAILWIDSHPDVGTPQSTPATTQWPSLRSPVTVTPTCWSLLPATVSPDRVALVGLHSWSDDDLPNVAEWGIQSFSPDELRENTRPVLDWLASTGCTRVAIHFDVDTIDSNEIVLGLGAEPGGLTSGEVRRIITDIDGTADIVGFTIAEFIPRQVMHLQQLLSGFPLISGPRAD
jgi:arginase